MKLFCMFTSSTHRRIIPRYIFFNDKSVPTGIVTEREIIHSYECVDSPKGALAYKNFSIMSTEKNFVDISQYANTTQLQETVNSLFETTSLTEIQENQNNLLNAFIDNALEIGYTIEHIKHVVFVFTLQNKLITQLYEVFKCNTNNSKN